MSSPEASSTQLCPIENFGVVPRLTSVTLSFSPGLAVISATPNFIVSLPVISMAGRRGPAAARRCGRRRRTGGGFTRGFGCSADGVEHATAGDGEQRANRTEVSRHVGSFLRCSLDSLSARLCRSATFTDVPPAVTEPRSLRKRKDTGASARDSGHDDEATAGRAPGCDGRDGDRCAVRAGAADRFGARTFEVTGVVTAPLAEGRVILAHDDIPGYMPAMTMPFVLGPGVPARLAPAIACGSRCVSRRSSRVEAFVVDGTRRGVAAA